MPIVVVDKSLIISLVQKNNKNQRKHWLYKPLQKS